ncbi:hypothetical protein SAMN04244573_02504 [Azotobacter beijerinckii]|uniref:Uncharacterized protein n=1 Tax=Azotobacter beijerinckii TaxID=170623 RepID=A0A1H9JV63_9GAMM|nr:hypothetical protein SAMN04244573_02504 [Azotobacter beijerinckii]
MYIDFRQMLTLHNSSKRLEARSHAASSREASVLWWSIRKIEKLFVTARLDAFPAVGGRVARVPGAPGQRPSLPPHPPLDAGLLGEPLGIEPTSYVSAQYRDNNTQPTGQVYA